MDASRYEVGNCIGNGNFGMVLGAKDKFLQCNVAIKRIPYTNGPATDLVPVMKEILILDILRHKNIISLLDIEWDRDAFFIVTEKCRTSLHSFIISDNYYRVTVEKLLSVMYQILEAVSYMHQMNIIHRDLKSGIFHFIFQLNFFF